MSKKSRKIAVILFFSGLLAAPVILFKNKPQHWQQNTLSALVHTGVAPFVYVLQGSKNTLYNIWSNYFNLVHVSKENKSLKQKLTLLESKIIDYEEQQRENNRLKQLLDLPPVENYENVFARVIGKATLSTFQTYKLSKGKKHGLNAGMPVTTPAGVVGFLLRSTQHFSDVLPLTDPGSQLDVLIQRTRVRGTLSGNGQNRCELKVEQHADVKIGDVLITSGFAGIFPKGLTIATITKVSYSNNNMMQSIIAVPFVDFTSLEEVVVLKGNNEKLEELVEIAGDQWIDSSLTDENQKNAKR